MTPGEKQGQNSRNHLLRTEFGVHKTERILTVYGKWRSTIKTGPTQRHKRRYVSRGFPEKRGCDCDDTPAPLVRTYLIRTVLAFAARQSMTLHLKTKTAYINADVDEDLFSEQATDFVQR